MVRFLDWPLRAKMVALLVVASLLPLVVAAWNDVHESRKRLKENTAALLVARSDHLADRLDSFHRSFQQSAKRIASLPHSTEYFRVGPDKIERVRPVLRIILDTFPASDANIRGAGILDLTGTVKVATEEALVGADLSFRPYIREALRGREVISDVHFAEPQVGLLPTIAYVAPVLTRDGKMVGLAALWVRADALWKVMKESHELAGPQSFAVLFDELGIRIAHTYSDEIVFHPGGRLPVTTIDALVSERRFGESTRTLLEDVRSFPEQFDRALSPSPNLAMFRGFAPVNQKWNYGVARRFKTVPWTVFYMVPEETLNAQIGEMTRKKVFFAAAIILAAMTAGTLFTALILKPVGSLSNATVAIADGNLAARVPSDRADELGRLAESFNSMAARIEAQSSALQKAREELELRVEQRTAELSESTKDLEAEIAERKRAEEKTLAQLARLNLLHQITRATGERQDLHSILQVVIRSLEDDLPIDFCCACLHDPVAEILIVNGVGVRSEALATELAMAENAHIPIDQNGLSRCVHGQLLYEPDIASSNSPFPRRLARGGLRSLVVAPLQVESKVFGVLVAARRQANSFSSGECEFLRQLSEHVALAAHQAQLHGVLQQAYDDLRQTQQAVMQQERLRSLGQMASGIAHDINNAISPVALYTESLLEKETNLSPHGREQLETIQRAIEDVAETVARMREFYRQREPQLTLTEVSLNGLVQQVVNLTRARWSDIPQRRGIVIHLETDLAPALPDIMGVESEIREALTNLIFNAVDAMPNGGTLAIRTKVTGAPAGFEHLTVPRLVQVEVSDTGVGMDEETRRRCLEPFFTTKGERGTGLGLAMAYGVVQRHSGEIEIDSAAGKGTTFRLSFPVLDRSSTGLTRTVNAPATVSRLRILLVDDDPLLLKSLCDTLEGDGHMIVTANGGQAGIDAFRAAQDRAEPFEAVITDLGMPSVDGRKVASAIKSASPSTPIILLTGWGQRIVSDGDIPPHVDLVLSKPPKRSQLKEALARCCGGSARTE